MQSIVGADAFGALRRAVQDCIRSTASKAVDPAATATRVWIRRHGQAALRASLPWFPWPDADRLADEVMQRLVGLN